MLPQATKSWVSATDLAGCLLICSPFLVLQKGALCGVRHAFCLTLHLMRFLCTQAAICFCLFVMYNVCVCVGGGGFRLSVCMHGHGFGVGMLNLPFVGTRSMVPAPFCPLVTPL